jgi:hypothetical protein
LWLLQLVLRFAVGTIISFKLMRVVVVVFKFANGGIVSGTLSTVIKS